MIGNYLQKFRKKKEFTQYHLSRNADIPYTLTKLKLNVVKNPSLQIVTKIAKTLDVNINDKFNRGIS